jgi:hypothetical protein
MKPIDVNFATKSWTRGILLASSWHSLRTLGGSSAIGKLELILRIGERSFFVRLQNLILEGELSNSSCHYLIKIRAAQDDYQTEARSHVATAATEKKKRHPPLASTLSAAHQRCSAAARLALVGHFASSCLLHQF